MNTLTLELTEETWRDNAAGLLFPVPPQTSNQTLLAHVFPEAWQGVAMEACNGAGKALWVPRTKDFRLPCRFTFGPAPAQLQSEPYRPVASPYTELPADLWPVLQGLQRVAKNDAQLAESIVAYVESRFEYESHTSAEAFPSIACNVQTGNCLDLHTALVGMLHAAGLPAVYRIGYFIEAGTRDVCDWHCWVGTAVGGTLQDWDIAHHMKRRLGPTRAGLNPVPGVRFAMSQGRGLIFSVAGKKVEISHFGVPVWVDAAGKPHDAWVHAQIS